jgi:predicted transcriptional regulator
MTAIQPESTLMRHASIENVLSTLESGEIGYIFVVDRESVVGLITGMDVVNSIQRRKLVAA